MTPRAKITSRMPRRDYEHDVAPRSLLDVLRQKVLHQWARGCIPSDTGLDDLFPELITFVDVGVVSYRGTVGVHDDARRMDAILPGQADGTVAPIVLKRGCYLGAGCIVLPGVTVGERAVVGAGAVVTRDVPAGKVVVGAPAKVVRDVGPLT